MAPTITSSDREARQVEQANASERTPVVFIHGLWLLPSSWDRWADLFEDAGYASVTPSWPDDPETVAEARAHPEVFAGKTLGQVADHTAEVIGGLEKKPAVMGHSTVSPWTSSSTAGRTPSTTRRRSGCMRPTTWRRRARL